MYQKDDGLHLGKLGASDNWPAPKNKGRAPAEEMHEEREDQHERNQFDISNDDVQHVVPARENPKQSPLEALQARCIMR